MSGSTPVPASCKERISEWEEDASMGFENVTMQRSLPHTKVERVFSGTILLSRHDSASGGVYTLLKKQISSGLDISAKQLKGSIFYWHVLFQNILANPYTQRIL